MITRADLVLRRQHAAKGCLVSVPNGLSDGRCEWCRYIDESLCADTAIGWFPTAYDRRFLKSLRIAIE